MSSPIEDDDFSDGESEWTRSTVSGSPFRAKLLNGSGVSSVGLKSPQKARSIADGNGSEETEGDTSSSSPSNSDLEETVIPVASPMTFVTPGKTKEVSQGMSRGAKLKAEISANLATPELLKSSQKARDSYRAGCRSLGLDPDVEGSEQDKMVVHAIENSRGKGSPDPSMGNGVRGVAASSASFAHPQSTDMDVPDRSFDEALEVGVDEYCAEEEEREMFLKECGIVVPLPIQTFRQRYNANKSEERFVLESLVLENFKSYANKVAVGSFNTKFTCIIGPNGSGKSNIIDALLFVFGYSSKRIRAAKTSDLIHKSDAFPDFKFCRVTVTFKRIIPGSDNYSYRNVEGSSYNVSREADSHGGSFFSMNGKKVTRAEVHARLMRDGIDLDHNRFLILQGEVEQIAMMKPKGKTEKDEEMLEFVEDIVGTNQYKTPISQLSNVVDKMAQEEELQNLKVHEFGKQMASMEAVKNETERFLKTENEVTVRRHILLQIERSHIGVKREAVLSKLKSCQEDLTAKETDLNSLLESRKSLEENHEAKKRYIRDLEKGDSVEERNFVAVESKRSKMQTKKKTLEESLPKLEAAKQKLNDQLKSKEGAPERLAEEIEALEADIANTKSNLDLYERTVREKIEKLPGLIGDRHDQIAALEARLAEVRKPLMVKRREVDDKKVEYDAFLAKHRRAVDHQDELIQRQEHLTTESNVLRQEITRLNEELPSKRQELAEIEPRVENLRQVGAQFNEEIRLQREQIDKAAAQSRIQTNDRVLARLLTAQRDGHLEGIVGRLGDLATIDTKYDVAISTNFGGRLDNVVVKDIPASKKVLEYLKQHNLGRVNLLVVDKLTDCVRPTVNRPFNPPANSQRFIDLIKPAQPEYKALFYYVVRDTLVTDTLDMATQIAYGREKHRVVSLDGKQVDGVSGSMSGGGDASRGKMRTNVQGLPAPAYDGRPIEELEKECRDREEEAEKNRTLLTQAEIRIADLQPEIRHRQQALEASSRRLEDFQIELERLIENIKKQAQIVKEATPDDSRRRHFDQEIDALKLQLKVDEDQAQEIQACMDEINGQIAAITKENVDEWRTKEKKAKTSLTKQEKDFLAKKSELGNHDAIVKKLVQDIEKRMKEILDKQSDLTKLAEEFQAVEEEWVTVRNELKIKKDKLIADKAEEKDMMSNITIFDGKIEKLENEAAHCRAIVLKTRTESESFAKQSVHLEKQLGAFKLNVIHSSEPTELKLLDPKELSRVSADEIEEEINKFKIAMGTMQPKLNILEEFYKLSDSREAVMKAVEEVRRKRKLAYSFYMELKNRRFSEFMDALRIIQSVLKTTYRQLTMGGDASLEPLDRFDPFSEGLEFMVKPKTKSWKNISYLSGGEKTISSLALIFALHYFKPTPFYIMDEIDAALDFRNTSVIAFFVKERALAAQFIIVSLRNQMFETAYRLIGICKPDHQSMAMYIDPAKHVLEEKEHEPRPTVTTIGRQTGSLFSQATQGPLLQADEDDHQASVSETLV